MPNSSDLLANLKTAGFRVTVQAGHLKVTPASRLTPELQEGLRANRAVLLALLEQRTPDVGPEHNTIPRLP